MLEILFQAIVVGYLPGMVIFRLPGRTRPTRATLAIDERLFWAVMLSAVWSLGVVLALSAIDRYTFRSLLVLNSVFGVVGIVAIPQLRYRVPTSNSFWPLLVPAALIGLGCWLFFPASEYVLGGKDPGSYMNEGVQIGQSGQLIAKDPTISAVPAQFRDLFFPSHGNPRYYGLRFVGYYVRDPGTGAVIGQFPQLYPAAIAIGYGLNGLSGARQAGPVWAILGLLAIYYAGAAWFGRAPAAAAAALVALNVIEVWFARYPTTEVMMQALTFAALLAFSRNAAVGGVFFGAIAGVLGGCMLFLRYDAVLVICALAGAAALLPAIGKRAGVGFWIGLSLTTLMGFWYLLDVMRAYMELPLAFMQDSGAIWLVVAGIVGLVAAPVILARSPLGAIAKVTIPPALAVTMVGLAIYAFFFRMPGGRLALADAMAFRSFGWYVTAPALGLAVCGFAWVALRSFWQAPAFLVTLTFFSVFFFYKIRIAHDHFWAARRFLPVILPGALLMATALIDAVVGSERWARLKMQVAGIPARSIGGAIAVTLCAAPIGWTYWKATWPVAHHVEYAGLIPKLEQLAGRFGDRDLVLLESRNAQSDLHVLGMPLAYIYARNILVLDSPVPSKRMLDGFVQWARTRYDNVWFLGSGGTDLLTATVKAEAVSSEQFKVPEYAAVEDAYPEGVRQKEFSYGIYRLLPTSQPEKGPVDLQIGRNDDVNVVRFHAKEVRGDGVPFRWSRGLSYVLLQGVADNAKTLTLYMSSGGRPNTAAVPDVTVTLGETVLGHASPVDELKPYRFAIPQEMAKALGASDDPARVTLRVPTWSPADMFPTTDTRDLGVMIARVTVE